MELFSRIISLAAELAKLARTLVADGMRFIALLARSRTALAAESNTRPRRVDNVTRFMLVLLSRGFAWFPGRFGEHKTIQNNRALEAAFRRAGVTDVSSHNLRKTFATRLLSRGAAITDVQHLLGHASVKTTEKAYAAFVKNERFKQTIDLLDQPVVPKLTVVK